MVEIIDSQIPPLAEEIYEVNLRGFVHDIEGNFLPEAIVAIGGLDVEPDQIGFFTKTNLLSSKVGTVIRASADGYLPTYHRVYDHRSLESVTVSASLIRAPSSITVANADAEIEITSDVRLSINSGDLPSATAITAWIPDNEEAILDPLIITDMKIEVMRPQLVFYFSSDQALIGDNTLDLVVAESLIDISSDLTWYYYDPIDLRWIEKSEADLSEAKYILPIDNSGWWSLATSRAAVHGSVQVTQSDDIVLENVNIQIEISDSKLLKPRTTHTDKFGAIHQYFAQDESIRISANDDAFVADVSEIFTKEDQSVDAMFSSEIYQAIEMQVLDCGLSAFQGAVVVETPSGFTIQDVNEAAIKLLSPVSHDKLDLQFYNVDATYIDDAVLDLTKVVNENVNAVACTDQMTISADQIVVENFDQCKVRLKPNESFIVGERMSGEKFLVSFSGAGAGSYLGLLYAISIADFDVGKIESDAVVNIEVYDLATNTIAGRVLGRYIGGEEFLIGFIGSIE